MGINSICWYCGAKDWKGKHKKCPADKLSKWEQKVGEALFGSEWCDHFCCGLPANVCRTKTIAARLKQ